MHAENQALYGQLVVSALLNQARSPQASSSSSDRADPYNVEPEREPKSQDPDEISDQEWEIRTGTSRCDACVRGSDTPARRVLTQIPKPRLSDAASSLFAGRAIYILQQTLPDFFSSGLVSSLSLPLVNPNPGSGAESWSLKQALGLADHLDKEAEKLKEKEKAKAKAEEDTSIYSPRVRLTYTPPTPLPAPFPKTLHVEGLHLYIASSVFLRHTLNALYTDLHVELKRVRVEGPPPAERTSSMPKLTS